MSVHDRLDPSGELTIFLKGKKANRGKAQLYVRTALAVASVKNSRRRKRNTGSAEFSAGSAVFSPLVWDDASNSWVESEDVEVK